MVLYRLLLLSVIALVTLNHMVSSYKVVCYYPNWSYWRKGIGKLTIQDIDPKLCTHIIYAFVVLDGSTYKIKIHDTYLDVTLENYKKVTDLKKQNSKLKVLVALGGWNDSQGSKYSTLVADPGKRARFITDAKAFVKKYNFDGLDLDWEYPGVADKSRFSSWIKELHEAFAPEGLEVTAAVSASTEKGYDIPLMSKYLDAIHLMEYDIHGSWEPSTANHHAPLYATGLSVDASVASWLSKGASPNKLVMGIPTYGRSWKLTGSDVTPPAAAQGAAPAGPYTGEAGSLAYFEICSKIQNEGWTKLTDPANKMGPWAYKLPSWVGYDDPAMAKIKAKYIKAKGLGGAMFWDMAMDDFKNTCGNGKNPIISAVRNILCGSSVSCGSTTVPSGTTVTSQSPGGTTASTTTTRVTTTRPSGGGFQCPGDGHFADPLDCNKYYQCASGTKYHKTCHAGTLWNQKVLSCDWPANVVCQTSSTVSTATASTTTTAASSTSPPPSTTTISTTSTVKPTTVHVEFKCPSDGFFADATSCNMYYQCYGSQQWHLACHTGQYWNQKAKACDYPRNVDCSSKTTESITQPSSSTTTKASSVTQATTAHPTTIKFTCPGDGLFADPRKCETYYHCWNNNAYYKRCPSGLHYNPSVKVCDWPVNANCQTSTDVRSNEVPGYTSVQCDHSVHFRIMCDSKHPTVYYECKKGSLRKKPCPKGTVWSNRYIGCVNPSDPRAGC